VNPYRIYVHQSVSGALIIEIIGNFELSLLGVPPSEGVVFDAV